MSLLQAFKPKEQPHELIFPRKGPIDASPQGMDGGIEDPFTPSLGALAVAGILSDVGDHARIENALAIVRGIKASIELQIGSSQVQTDRCVYTDGHGIAGADVHIRSVFKFKG